MLETLLGTFNLNTFMLLLIAVLGFYQVREQRKSAAESGARTELAKSTNALAIQTKDIAVETKKNTDGLVDKLLKSEKEVSRREGVDLGRTQNLQPSDETKAAVAETKAAVTETKVIAEAIKSDTETLVENLPPKE